MVPKKQNKRRPNRGRSKGKDKKDYLEDFSNSREDRMDKKSGNDPAWYANNPQLLKDAASYPFSQPLGRRFTTGTRGATTYETIPGIYTLRVKPAFGYGGRVNPDTQAMTADVNNPINVAAAEIFTFVRHANSGAKNYEASDLMMYICAMSQVYSAITWGMRLYGLARMFEQRNRYMPVYLIEANGVSADSIMNNLADFRYGMNVLINKVSSLKVPSNIPIFQRQAFLYQNVYSEGLSVKDQLYMYVPDCFLKFDLDTSGAGQLATRMDIPRPTGTLLTFQGVLDIIDEMFQAVWDEEDFATMSGDISKAYMGNTLVLNSMNEDYGLIPVYDEMVLTQMKNSTVCGSDYNTALHQVSLSNYTSILVPLVYGSFVDSDTDPVHYQKFSQFDANHVDKILSINAVEPTPEMVIEATRMMSIEDELETFAPTETRTDTVYQQYIACGTEIVSNVIIGHVDGGTSTIDWHSTIGRDVFVKQTSEATVRGFAPTTFFRYSLLKAFKYAARLLVYVYTYDTDQYAEDKEWNRYSIAADIFEVDNYNTMDSQELKKLHESAILSLLHVGSNTSNAKS